MGRLTPALLVTLLFSSCAKVQTRVSTRDIVSERILRRAAAVVPESPSVRTLAAARRITAEGERMTALVEAARLALPGALRGEPSETAAYHTAVRELVESFAQRGFRALPPGSGIREIRISGNTAKTWDPALAGKLIPARQMRIRGLDQRVTRKGLGVPFVAWLPADAPALKGQPGIPPRGMTFPTTAILGFSGTTARLDFLRSRDVSEWRVSGHRTPVAADFSAPLAMLISHGRNRSLDLAALLRSDLFFQKAGLFQMQPYAPDKIPVIFIHGLLARPETWTQAINVLQGDPRIRSRFQFWLFHYPTGLPVWQSTALLRKELERFDEVLDPEGKNPLMRRKILIGHSMGGLIASLLVRRGGDVLWNKLSEHDLNSLRLDPELDRAVREMVFFEPRHDIERVIFIATPHRGSPMALRSLAHIGATLIRLPAAPWQADRRHLIRSLRDNMRDALHAPGNSIRGLRANSPILLSILDLPLTRRIPLHSIIGNRGLPGPLALSSDGVVPYWSAHLENATSEKIVPSGHGANEHPQAIREIARILDED